MITLHYSILVLLFCLADDYVRSAAATNQQQPDSVSAILESYANSFSHNQPKVPFLAHIELKEAETNVVPKYYEGYGDLSAQESQEDEDPKGPPDHEIPYTEHEDPKEPSTKPNYTAPGDWAKPPPEKNIPLEFVPSKLYAQVRGTHTVKHLPKERAVESAETEEEKENAARLKEVVKISKANTIYTEEGYEDAAYDHAGQIRDADFHEGFARKLKEDHERKKIGGDYVKKPLRLKKNKKPQKNKSRDFDEFNDDYRDHLAQEPNESRTLKKEVKPENAKVLEKALNKSVIDLKSVAEEGISKLEEDLRTESYESERTSTDPYNVPTTTYKVPVTTEAISQNYIAYETTTARQDVYTVRPRRPATTVKPKLYLAKVKRPVNYYPGKTINGNYNDQTNNPYSVESATVSPSNLLWNYYKNNPIVTHRSSYAESQPIDPVSANPLAVATVNGHGPYLVVVTSKPSTLTSSPLESKTYETAVDYGLIPAQNVTKPTLINSYVKPNSFFTTEPRAATEVTSDTNVPQYTYPVKNQNYVPPAYQEEIVPTNERIVSLPRLESQSNYAKMLEYLKNEKNNYEEYYTVMQPPRAALVTYPDYSRGPYNNVLEQWSVTHENKRPVESVYDVMEDSSRPRVDPAVQKSTLPVTRLLPPAPLSGSEYASFHLRGRRSEPIMPTSIMTIVPIIEAIRKHESGRRRPFPFLFRKKRSALGHSREWEITQRDKKLQKAEASKIEKAGSTRSEKKTTKYPDNFEHLLNESPKVVTDVVNKEIAARFKEKSKEIPEEESEEDGAEGLMKGTIDNPEEDVDDQNKSKEDVKAKNLVEVEVPELDFSNVFEEDEPEPSTEKPGIDTEKYPFYGNDKVSKSTALKYIVNPLDVPRKTLGGMEFYNSRSLECDEIEPNLEKIMPEEEELESKRGARKSKPRLHGLGDKVDCFKAKYFDENPFDNPLFLEDEIEVPSSPSELDPKKFASRIFELPSESDEYVIPRGPKSPEDFTSVKRHARLRDAPKSTANYNYAQRTKHPDATSTHSQRHKNPTSFTSSVEYRAKQNKNRSRNNVKNPNLTALPSYQRQVYEDVMGNIMNFKKLYKAPESKRSRTPHHPKHNLREYSAEQEKSGYPVPFKQHMPEIDGLVPPPQHAVNIDPFIGSKFSYSNQRHNRHTLNEPRIPSMRIFKRSVAIDDVKKAENLTNPINVTKTVEKSTFRIILTTPIPDTPKRKRKTVTIISDDPTTTPKTVYTIYDRIKHTDGSTEDLGKYDKFTNQENVTSSIDLRRKEPRYNNSSRRGSLTYNSSTTTSSPIKSEITKIPVQSPTDASISGSTLIPVIVRPDESFTSRVPQESKTRYTKQKLEELDRDAPQEQSNEFSGESEEPKENEKDSEKAKNQYLVHENIQEEPEDEKTVEVVTELVAQPDAEEHKELFEFLKGDPPGYTESFSNEKNLDREESKTKDSHPVEESKDDTALEEEVDPPEAEEEPKEAYVSEGTSEDAEEEEPKENAATEKNDEQNSKSKESDGEPFSRYSARPFSPPENYEDDRYSDLGPRVNKPYFHHPPFEVPEYEKYTLGKVVDRSDDDEWGRSEETEDHEKFVFPWEKDKEDEEEKTDESQHYSTLGRYEYPWERRERKEKERKKRERLRKKYANKYYHGHKDEDDDGSEATNTKPIYVPLKKKHTRGKKDVNSFEISPKSPVTKFSSKYKSGEVKIPLEDDEMLITVANSDEIKQSILNYLQNSGSSSPKIRTKTLQKSILNDTYSVSTTTNLPNKSNGKSDSGTTARSATQKPLINSTTSIRTVRSGRTTAPTPTSTSISTLNSTSTSISTSNSTIPTSTTTLAPKHQSRIRSRKAKITNIKNNDIEKVKVTNQSTERPSSSTPTSRVNRRRGRTRDSSITSSTVHASTSSPRTINRRRGRPATSSTTTPGTTSTTPKPVVERRRRPFKVQSSTEKSSNSKKADQSSPTTLSSVPTSTGRTIEHHSRVSKEEIITKTFYPDEDEDDEDDDASETSSKHDNVKTGSEKKPFTYIKVKRKNKPQNDSQDEHPTMKEKVEKVTITMEETPNHVYRTKEIDKDGVKGKFITITTNNNSVPTNSKEVLRVKDAEIEEMKRKMDAFNTFDSVIRDTDDLTDNSSGVIEAENYLVGNLLQRLPVPAATRTASKIVPKEDDHRSDRRVSEDNNEDSNEDEDSDDDADNRDDDSDYDDDEGDDSDDESTNNNSNNENNKNEKSVDEKTTPPPPPVAKFIKEPNNRLYFYVQPR